MVRLRQVALVAAELAPAAEALQEALGLDDPFHDPGVAEFGLHNAVFAVGDTFLEIVAPIRDHTAAGRYLAKHGRDGGYMAIFQVPDTGWARTRAHALGVRVVWQIDLEDISGTHFHPKDVPGAIVSVDTPRPPETWRWGGPGWTGQVPDHDGRSIAGITVACDDPQGAATVWGALLDVNPTDTVLRLDGGRQSITFQPANGIGEGIIEVAVSVPGSGRSSEVCGVTFRVFEGR